MQRPGKAAVSMGLLFGAAYAVLAGEGQWTNEGLQGTQVYSLGIGHSPKTLFAGADLGVFRSTEAGAWTQIPGSAWPAKKQLLSRILPTTRPTWKP